MPGWLKALLAVVIIIVLLVVGVIVGGVVWWSRNKDKLLARGKEVMTEGRDFGRNTDNQGCVDESMSRYKKEPGFTNAISTSLFTRACLDASRATPGFCSDVPKPTEFIKSGQWRVEQCRRAMARRAVSPRRSFEGQLLPANVSAGAGILPKGSQQIVFG